jgi:hypothetical protein
MSSVLMASLLFNRLTMKCSQVKGREGGRLINLSLVKQTPDRLPLVLKLKSAWQLLVAPCPLGV